MSASATDTRAQKVVRSTCEAMLSGIPKALCDHPVGTLVELRVIVSERLKRREASRREQLTPTGDETVDGDDLGNKNLGTLLELDEVLGSVVGVDVDPVGILLARLGRLEVVLKLNLLSEALLLRFVAAEELCDGESQGQ